MQRKQREGERDIKHDANRTVKKNAAKMGDMEKGAAFGTWEGDLLARLLLPSSSL